MSEQADQPNLAPRPWTKGGPSPNPAGRGSKRSMLRKAPGSDGVIAPSGYLFSGERHPDLSGSSKWARYDNLIANIATVATAMRVWLDLAGSVKWIVQEKTGGGADAKRCAELVHDGLIAAHMPKPWRSVVKRQAMKKFRGFALHAKGTKRNRDGAVIIAELAHRPQWTIERWIKPTETDPWTGVIQRTRMGATFTIDRRDLFYSVEDALTDAPDGVGLLRHLVEVERVFTRYRQLQGIAFDTDINGVPLGRAPLSKLAELAVTEGGISKDDPDAIAAWVRARVSPISELIEHRVVVPNRSLLLDSLPYYSVEPDGSQRPSGIYEWSVDTIKSIIGSIPELRQAINDLNREMARLMCAEWLLMGDGEGARAVHTDKTAMFGAVINACLDDIADDATRDLARWIVAANGYDPEICTPTLVHEPVPTQSVREAAETLALLAKANLLPTDEAIDVLRERMDLPPAPEVDPVDDFTPLPVSGDDKVDPGDDLPDEDEED